MKRSSSLVALAGVLAGATVIARTADRPPVTAADDAPRYDAAGRLLVPSSYREWVFLSSGLDMSYAERAAAPTAHVFDNVFAAPGAYRRFKATGHWPDKTVLILENRDGRSHGSINKAGQFQVGGATAVEAHVRDVARVKGGWGFFAFDGATPAERIDYRADCYSCHLANAAVDTTFVQFYPTLLPIATAHGSISPAQRQNPLATAP